MKTILNYINGELCQPANGKYLSNFNPATADNDSQLPDSGSQDIEKAIIAATKAFYGWSQLPLVERAAYLDALAFALESRLSDFALAESKDTGKPLSLATSVDIPRAVYNLRFFASGLQHMSSESHHSPGSINYTLRQPLGVVGCISPWNLPLYLLTWKIAPALAAGNCVIAKPSEVTPMTAFMLSELCQEVGLPPGVLNIIHGKGPHTGPPLCQDPRVKAISFTGSTRVGREIAKTCAPEFKKYSLEMGGKNAALIFADCDYEKMLNTVVRSSFSNQGQICLCTSRLLVESSVYQRFKKDFVARVEALKVGDPESPETNQGALVSKAHFEKVLSSFDLARSEGASILCGGKALEREGWFIEPTVIEGLSMNCRFNQEEAFGPVVSLIPFETYEDALSLANDSDYGLTASIWTQDISKAQLLSESLETGMVWVNTWMNRDLRTPFGGVKSSGVGREGGWEAFRFFTQPKNVCVEY